MAVKIENCSSEELLEAEGTTTDNIKNSRRTYTKAFMLSLSNLQNCKDLPEDFDPSVLRDLKRTYSRTFMLFLSNLQICKELPEDFDSSVLQELDASEHKLGMQRTSAILPSYPSNTCYIGSSPVIRCDLVADSRGLCGRWENKSPLLITESSLQENCDTGLCCKQLRCLLRRWFTSYKYIRTLYTTILYSDNRIDADSRAQNDCSGILGSSLCKSKNPYRPPQSYKVGNSNSYARHSSKETKSQANISCTAQEEVQLHNDTLQENTLGGKSFDVVATHRIRQITKLSEGKKAVDKFVDEEKSQCKANDSIHAAFATSQQEQLLLVTSTNLEESEKGKFGTTLEKEVSLPYTDFPGREESCLMGPCTARTKNDIIVNNLAEGRPEKLKLNLESKEDTETKISNELPSQGNSYERISKINELEPSEYFLAPVLLHCGAFGTDGEGITKSIFDCELELDGIEESKSPLDDFWTETLAIIHLEQESNINYSADTVDIIDFKVPLCSPDEDELMFLNCQEGTKEPKIPTAGNSTDLDFVEDEINLPDEDSLISVDSITKHMFERSMLETYTADSVDSPIDAYCSEAIFAGRTDILMANFIADNTEHLEVTHCYEKSYLPGLEVPASPDLSSSATHQKSCPKQTFSQISCFDVTPEIPNFHPFDLYFTCPSFQNLRDHKLVYYNPTVYGYPWSDIDEYSMKTTPVKEKNCEYVGQYSLLHQPDSIQQVVYDLQEWGAMQILPETYQPHCPGLGFQI